MRLKATLTQSLAAVVQSFLTANTGAVVPVEELRWGVPPSPEIGDYSSDLPAILARRLGRGAAEVAAEFASRIQFPDGLVDRVDATRSGFLNIRLSEAALWGRVSEIVDTGVGYGADPTVHNGSRILLEFVSAQPTGPLTTAHGRSAAFGDSLAAILEACGAAVTRESYVNDAGIHLDRLVRSVSALGRTHLGEASVRFPLDGYQTSEAHRIAELLAARKPELFARPAAALLTAVRDEVLSGHGSLLSKLGLSVDNWVLETDVSAPGGHLETSLRRLKSARRSYEEAGATWLRSTEFGDQQDRVLVRGNGRPTYLACDLAYHAGKFARGYDHLIDVWGVDHSLYVERTLAGIRALDLPEERLSILILQPVQFQRDGVTLDGPELGNTGELSDVVNLIGPEMTRFMLVSAPASVSLGIDLSDIAASPASESLSSIRSLRDRLKQASLAPDAVSQASGAERVLCRRLAEFPDVVAHAGLEREPNRIYRYAQHLAADASTWVGRGGGGADLPAATLTVLENALRLLGVSLGG